MSTFDDVLNFIMPIVVFGFLAWTVYRIPIFREMVNWIGNKFQELRESRENSQTNISQRIETIQYE